MRKNSNSEDQIQQLAQPDAPLTSLYGVRHDNNNGDHSDQESNHTPQSPIRRDRPRSLDKHKSRSFTYLDAGFIIKGVATYIFDVVTDIIACIRYFTIGDIWWGVMTLVFVLIASVTVQAASFRWYMYDNDTQTVTRKQTKGVFTKMFEKTVWIPLHVLQLATLNRYLRCLYFGWKSRESKRSFEENYIWKVYEQRDLTMLRLMEAFMEAGPQLVLQIYIMLQLYIVSALPQFYWVTALSAISSLLSLSWALEAYHKALRESLETKNDISYFGFAFRYIWRVSMITSRVTAMALFALQFEFYIFPAIAFHWALMTVWLISQKTEFCETKTEERLFCGVIAVVHIFCFFNMKEGQTRQRMAVYYILVLFENSVMAGLWYYYSGMYINHNYGIMALSFVWAGFFIGILTMMIYYGCFHPNHSRISETDANLSQTSGYGTETGTDTVEGVYYYQDVPDGFTFHRKKSDKRRGNMFTKSGRRYLYWRDAHGAERALFQHLMKDDENQNITNRKVDYNNIDVEITADNEINNVNNIIEDQQDTVSHETSV
ncbi:XK-related protein 6-like [Amphiura filiformis]|uniref:XK-related protein 6-like n=1 Tax=Amphiura filiformis TaxID=82378 RepID=UPI003B20DB89